VIQESCEQIPGTKEIIKYWGVLALQENMLLDKNFDLSTSKAIGLLKEIGVSTSELSLSDSENSDLKSHPSFTGISLELPKLENKILEQNLKWLQRRFNLSKTEILILTLVYLSQRDQIFQNLLAEFSNLTAPQLIRLISRLVSSNEIVTRQLLDNDAKLGQLGILKSKLYEDGALHTRFVIVENIYDYLSNDELTLAHFSGDMVRSSFAELKMNDFPHMLEDIEDLKTFIAQVCEQKVAGINILIHGPDASGKTQFVRSMADSLNLVLYETISAPIKKISLEGRLQSILRAQNLLQHEKNAVLVVDDFQNLLDIDSSDSFLGVCNPYAKRFINNCINKNTLPTIWVTNRLDIFSYRDMARFSFCLEFKKPTRAMRQEFLRKKLNGLMISEAWVIKTAMKENVPFETLEKISHFTKLICQSNKQSDAEAVFDKALRKSTQYLSSNQAGGLAGFDIEKYSSEFINADTDLHDVCESLRNHSEARLCLSGPPGCGKTAYAYYLSYLLEKPVISKKASDILGRYLGDTEQNLAGSFLDAKNSDAILLLDEVDGLLTNRKDAVRSWEISMVNELLTQIDTYKGLLIVTTNLFDKIDSAAMRRFDLKVTFDYLNAEQIAKLWDAHTRRFELDSDDEIRLNCMKIKGLTPGDFKNIERQSKFLPVKNSLDLFTRLAKEVSFKKDHGINKSIGFLNE
jgi:transitional endoplasmic reticulum ATPase